MRLLSFNVYRSLGLPGVHYVKPEHLLRHRDAIRAADWVLFPETWQVNALLYAFKARIFPSPASYYVGYNKVEMTRALEVLVPDHLPRTLILPATAAAVAQVVDELSFPVVLKEPRNSMGRGVFLVESRAELLDHARRLEVLYVQECLPLEADLRVVYVGDRVVTAYWRRGGDGFHHNIAAGAEADFADVPEAAVAIVDRVARELGINYAGFDIAMVGGHPYFLELNLFFGYAALKARDIHLGPVLLDYLERLARPGNEPPRPVAVGF
jgi:ribosomal protein S6--L-glutamate ligase